MDELPGLIGRLADQWALRLGRRYDGSTESVVIAVDAPEGPAVLKLPVPSADEPPQEAAVLRFAEGRGLVRLVREDATSGALLLERLGPTLAASGLSFERRLPVLCEAARSVWRPADHLAARLPSGAEKAARLAAYVTRTWAALGEPCSAGAVDYAVECARRRGAAHRAERAVLNHGDVHQWNALRAGEGYRLVDPDGLLAEPEYDLGVLLREDPLELLRDDPWERARRLAAWTDLDMAAIWEWGTIERVSTALTLLEIGLEREAREMFAAAERVTASRRTP